MDLFLKFLIHKMRTLDGFQGSADKLLELANMEGEETFKKKVNKNWVSESVRQNIKQTNEHKIFRKTYLKYLLMRVRQKISFIAFERRMTIPELFVHTITKCYRQLMNTGSIPAMTQEEFLRHELLYKKMNHNDMAGFTIAVAEFNKFRVSKEEADFINLRVKYMREQTLHQRRKIGINQTNAQLLSVKNKEGQTKSVKIDPEMNEVLTANIKIISDKENCLDIFRDIMTVITDNQEESKVNERKFIKDKMMRHTREKTFNKLNMVIKMRAISGLAYLRCLQRRIQISKELFILEIE